MRDPLVITLVGFKMAGQKPDTDHPFGHGRIEYVSGLLVSFIILMMASRAVSVFCGEDPAPWRKWIASFAGASDPCAFDLRQDLYVSLQRAASAEQD